MVAYIPRRDLSRSCESNCVYKSLISSTPSPSKQSSVTVMDLGLTVRFEPETSYNEGWVMSYELQSASVFVKGFYGSIGRPLYAYFLLDVIHVLKPELNANSSTMFE
ncbi:hypothetical protein PIB30_012531 [Stylosanthes scabra]|uniref:Uncharacterized protein n=1 Tax=Stylosanthes scabra TaxID=79078 RepID=A0ABU6V8F5_9FABA|nr:hypothetical protein [Stylosanthes scabra]